MIRRTIKYGISCLLAILCMACQQESLTEVAKGSFSVTLLQDTLGITTKATPAALDKEITALFQLTIRDAAGNTHYEGAFTEQNIAVPEGTYTLTATYGEEKELALDAPYYVGTQPNMTAKVGETTPVEISCKVANALISVDWGDRTKFEKVYADYGIRVKVGSSQVTLSPNSEKSAYLKAGTSYSLTFIGTLTDSQTEVNIPLSTSDLPPTLEASDHCKLTLKIDDKATLQIQKAEVTVTTIQATIPLTWLPAPTVSAQGFDNQNQLTFYETAAPLAQLNLGLSSQLQDMSFTIDFQDETYQSLNGDYQLSTITEEQKKKLSTAGIILPTIGVQAGACVVMGDLLGKLQATNEGDVINTFTLKSVKANDRDIAEPITYQITVKKPKMEIALPDYAIYTKQFTIDECVIEGGNERILRNGLKYQYKFDNTDEWINCSNSNQQLFEQQPATKSFQVRAIYNNRLSSNIVSGTLEEEAQTPNAHMDEWTSTTREARVSGVESYNQPFFYPWATESNHWWDTNTLQTMPTSITSCLLNTDVLPNVKSFPTATYEDLSNGNKAALVRTISVNDGNTSGTSLGSNIRGILFAGTADGSGNMTEGRPWLSRPTAMTFQAKYNSYDNERFGVYVELYNGETLIASGSLLSINGESVTAYTAQTVSLNYAVENLKATSIRIRFCSVAEGDKPAIKKEKEVYLPTGNRKAHAGSELYIDDIQLIYDK